MNLLKYASGIFCATGVESDMLHQSKKITTRGDLFTFLQNLLAFRGSLNYYLGQ